MSAEHRADHVWGAIVERARAEGTDPSLRHVLHACAAAVGAAGCGLSMVGATGAREPVLAVGEYCDELEELQFTLGQGPGVDAAAGDGVVLVPDLAAGSAVRRWPVFAPAATDRGVRGLFAFPVAAGAARVGVLDVYRRDPGALDAVRLATALAFADAVLVVVLDESGGIAGGPDHRRDAILPERLAEVHQAAGMVSVQLGVEVSEALVRLRAYAYVHERRLADVAAEVVARRLRFAPDRRGTDDTAIGSEMMDAPPNSDQDRPEGGA
ncbi:ANTAR domain-containing protein [Jiangella aurantiaca]|uniref:ANTAR domain-containing protein n=1 Tax=Jiangella aurantiaca TaxID=2530373 RepID=A0A4R5AB40_9ACTN|nr:ANTAR domain-containing protein [Jiangella aurantiaca]TDD68199.1 ANTAR domain-containing protein [Jiangella aurantiaca]